MYASSAEPGSAKLIRPQRCKTSTCRRKDTCSQDGASAEGAEHLSQVSSVGLIVLIVEVIVSDSRALPSDVVEIAIPVGRVLRRLPEGIGVRWTGRLPGVTPRMIPVAQERGDQLAHESASKGSDAFSRVVSRRPDHEP